MHRGVVGQLQRQAGLGQRAGVEFLDDRIDVIENFHCIGAGFACHGDVVGREPVA